ncbi:transcriptional regulator with XRE-family HTH domain [Rhodococcus sp. OAS809]|uniref:helix-turn-helix domain-containing protein n=1 Tax=Rhodococcus sp. OAS809 TaxID=2663874 RepID=UPI001789C25C
MNLQELGAFLRSRRDRVSPDEVQIPTGTRRRVAGLRRDEVAELAHVSVDYYIEIERGTAQPSAGVLDALTAALRMSEDERAHAFTLAGRRPPRHDSTTELLPAMRDLLGRFGDVPAYVTTDLQLVLAQNSAATALHGPIPESSDLTASYVYRWFTNPAVRAQFDDAYHDAEARALVADLRVGVARRGPLDLEAAELIGVLAERSPWFARLWSQQDVGIRRAESKRLNHPGRGSIKYDCYALLSDDARQRVVWYVPTIESSLASSFDAAGGKG